MGATLRHTVVSAAALPHVDELEREPLMSRPLSTLAESPPVTQQRSPAAPALPRLLAGISPHGAMTLEEHLSIHGQPPLAREQGRRRERNRTAVLIDEIEHAGLLGRGGAAFPTATKMRAVTSSRGRAIVVANAAEGEPASLKDRTLLEALPHLVLDGAVLAAQAVGADEAIVCVCESADASIESIEQALEERLMASDYAAFDRSTRLHLTSVPSHYVAGQESALVNYLNGRPAKPTFTPPMPYEQGVGRRPTLINNAETLAHIALIARHGAQWFRQLGTPTQPGSALVTLSGPVAHPGVYEIEHGASLTSLIDAGGGTTARLRAALLGGYAGAWIGAERLQGVALSNEHLAPHGASLGAGVVLLLSEDACPVAETVHVARWLSGQSTRQCGPCVHGLDALAAAVEQIAGGGVAPAAAAQRIDRLASVVRRRGACGHPDGTVNFVLSALEAFQSEFADHARHGPCDACARAGELPLPVRPVIAATSSKPIAR
jgi:NADH:ubiquinone oxidoreductase subunit F (NADH-binding)